MRGSRHVIAGFAMITIVHALAAGALAAGSPPPPAPIASASGASSGASPDRAIVRVVTAPGGLSAEMRTAIENLDGLFARAPEHRESLSGPARSRFLLLGAGFMNVYVARLDADGKVHAACTSSLSEALRAMEPAKAPGALKLGESQKTLALEER